MTPRLGLTTPCAPALALVLALAPASGCTGTIEQPFADDLSAASASRRAADHRLIPDPPARPIGHPCAGAADLFACQPMLLAFHMAVAFDRVFYTMDTVTRLGDDLGLSGDEAGTVSIDDPDMGRLTVEYASASDTRYEVLIKRADTGESWLHALADDDHYELAIVPTQAGDPEAGDADAPGITAAVDFTDFDNWRGDFLTVTADCRPGGVPAADSVFVAMSRTDGIGQGKVHMLHPRWRFTDGHDEPACHDQWGVGLYTDFATDWRHATASVFLVPAALDDPAKIPDYPLHAWFGDVPGGGSDQHHNPMCLSSSGTTWGAPCDSASDIVSTPIYSDPAQWRAPAEPGAFAIELPGTILD